MQSQIMLPCFHAMLPDRRTDELLNMQVEHEL